MFLQISHSLMEWGGVRVIGVSCLPDHTSKATRVRLFPVCLWPVHETDAQTRLASSYGLVLSLPRL